MSSGSSTCSASMFSCSAFSSMRRSRPSDAETTLRMMPVPSQRGQARSLVSLMDERKRWRDISNKPNLEILPICTRARSGRNAARNFDSTARSLAGVDMSMRSMTTKPPKSRMRNWRAISSTASRLVCSAVSSMSAPLVARAELTSMEVSASVWSMTTDAPDGRRTSRLNADSICCSTWKRENSGMDWS